MLKGCISPGRAGYLPNMPGRTSSGSKNIYRQYAFNINLKLAGVLWAYEVCALECIRILN